MLKMVNRTKGFTKEWNGEIDPAQTQKAFTVPDGMVYVVKSFTWSIYGGNGSDEFKLWFGTDDNKNYAMTDSGLAGVARFGCVNSDIPLYPGDSFAGYALQYGVGTSKFAWSVIWTEIAAGKNVITDG